MNRLPTSISTTASIVEELYEIDDGGFEDIEAFTVDGAGRFAAADIPREGTGVDVPAVPDQCAGDAVVAAAALQSHLRDLGQSLAYQTFF